MLLVLEKSYLFKVVMSILMKSDSWRHILELFRLNYIFSTFFRICLQYFCFTLIQFFIRKKIFLLQKLREEDHVH